MVDGKDVQSSGEISEPRKYLLTMYSLGESRMVDRIWSITFVVRPAIEIVSVIFEDKRKGLRFIEKSSTKSELYNRLIDILVRKRTTNVWDMEPRQFDKEDQHCIDAMRLAYAI